MLSVSLIRVGSLSTLWTDSLEGNSGSDARLRIECAFFRLMCYLSRCAKTGEFYKAEANLNHFAVELSVHSSIWKFGYEL